MKKLLVLAGVALIATWGVAAPNLDAGTSEIGVGGFIDGTSADGTVVELGGTYGYFVADNIELGVKASVRDSDNVSNWRIAGFGEYDIPV
jgi:hypothetical protein